MGCFCSTERGFHRGEDQIWGGERLHRWLDEEKNLRRLQGDPGVWSQTPSTGLVACGGEGMSGH